MNGIVSDVRTAVSDALPAISVVVVTPRRFANIRRTVRHLRAQTMRERLELIVVAPSGDALADAAPHELDGFHSVRLLDIGAIHDVDKSAADGVRHARAEVVGIIEDHAFAEPEWAEAMLAAHAGPWVAVASTMVNANPRRQLSWCNLLVAYGPSVEPTTDGARDAIPGHNVSFKRAALAPFGDALRDRFGREGGLLDALRANGGQLFLSERARVHHINPSTWAATAEVRFNAGRLYGARRAQSARWSAVRRLLYTAAGPLIPFVRYSRVTKELFGDGRRAELARRVAPAVFGGLVLDAIGQMAGYALGEGNSRHVLTHFELDRMLHIPADERREFEEARP
jgi:hypothetical protein